MKLTLKNTSASVSHAQTAKKNLSLRQLQLNDCGEDKEEVFNCYKCEFKAKTKDTLAQHLDKVHLAGFETITNMNKS